jgi:uncharacterized protein (DUF433 family)
MTTRARGVRLPEELEGEIQREAERSRRNWSQMVAELLEEAVRMRRAPGIIFSSGPTGRRATVAGTGLDVWEVVATWRAYGEDYDELRQSYDWLAEAQLRAALSYYELYPDEIDERLERERCWTADRVRSELPFARPRRDD